MAGMFRMRSVQHRLPRDVADDRQISVDLAETVNAVAPWFNKLAVFLVALTPLTKFPVAIRIVSSAES